MIIENNKINHRNYISSSSVARYGTILIHNLKVNYRISFPVVRRGMILKRDQTEYIIK